jgi:hypothetical protein
MTLVWRDGRPRFVPGAGLRARGVKGKDLKHADGNWMTIDEAKMECVKLRAKATKGEGSHGRNWRKLRKAPTPSQRKIQGYVYAMIVGEMVKIGFSKNPWNRLRGLITGFPTSPIIMAVPGSKFDEGVMHWINKTDHLEGEWFSLTTKVMGSLLSMVKAGRVPEIRKNRDNTLPTEQNKLNSNQ